jgi:hypothetical protein
VILYMRSYLIHLHSRIDVCHLELRYVRMMDCPICLTIMYHSVCTLKINRSGILKNVIPCFLLVFSSNINKMHVQYKDSMFFLFRHVSA